MSTFHFIRHRSQFIFVRSKFEFESYSFKKIEVVDVSVINFEKVCVRKMSTRVQCAVYVRPNFVSRFTKFIFDVAKLEINNLSEAQHNYDSSFRPENNNFAINFSRQNLKFKFNK